MIGRSIGSERVSHPNRSVGAAKERLLKDRREDQHGGASDKIIPEVTDIRCSKEDEHERLGEQRRDKHGCSSDSTDKERCQKQTEDAAVEYRAKNVPRFDQ